MKAETKWKALYLIPGIVLAAVILLVLGTVLSQKKGTDTVMTIDGQTVTREEYQMVLSSLQGQVQSAYSTEEANREDFWTRSGEDAPLGTLMNLALEKLKEEKVILAMAREKGISADLDYESIKAAYEADAGVRSDREDQEQTVYGPDSLSMAAYYDYCYASLRSELEEALKAEYTLTEEELMRLYRSQADQYTYEVQVTVTVCEMKAEDAQSYGTDVITEAVKNSESEELQKQFPDAGIYEMTMNSLDTQAGKSGVYEARWDAASRLQEGEISEPVQIEGNVLVIKCTDRQENGTVDLESVQGVLESQYQTEMAEEEIEEHTEDADVKYKKKDLQSAALELLEEL